MLYMPNGWVSQVAQKYYSMLVGNRKADAIQKFPIDYSLYNLYKFRKKKLKINYIINDSDLKQRGRNRTWTEHQYSPDRRLTHHQIDTTEVLDHDPRCSHQNKSPEKTGKAISIDERQSYFEMKQDQDT